MQSPVYHIDCAEKVDVLLQKAGNSLIVLDFTASWCGPCKRFAPFVEQMGRRYDNAIIAKIDVDEVPEIAQSFHVSSMPTFVFIRNRKELTRFSGANQKQFEESIIHFSS